MGDDGDVGIAGPGPADSGEMGEADFGDGLFGGMEGIVGEGMAGADLSSILSNLDFNEIGLDGLLADDSNFDLSALFNNMPEMNVVSEDSQFDISKMSKLASMLASLNPATAAAAPALGMMGIASSNNPVAGMVSMGIGAMAGPVAAAIANGLGIPAAIGNTIGAANPTGENFSGSNQAADIGADGSNMLGALPGLLGAYGNYQGQKQTGQMLGGLQSLYAQDSPYAQAMRQSLQRQDAAGGRRSQYGPREVELQAKLAQLASQQIPGMTQLGRDRYTQRNQMMQQGLGAFQKLGGVNALRDLFMQGRGGLFETANMGGGFGTPVNNFDLGGLFGAPQSPLESLGNSWQDFGSIWGG